MARVESLAVQVKVEPGTEMRSAGPQSISASTWSLASAFLARSTARLETTEPRRPWNAAPSSPDRDVEHHVDVLHVRLALDRLLARREQDRRTREARQFDAVRLGLERGDLLGHGLAKGHTSGLGRPGAVAAFPDLDREGLASLGASLALGDLDFLKICTGDLHGHARARPPRA
jgi:hypothetical protein